MASSTTATRSTVKKGSLEEFEQCVDEWKPIATICHLATLKKKYKPGPSSRHMSNAAATATDATNSASASRYYIYFESTPSPFSPSSSSSAAPPSSSSSFTLLATNVVSVWRVELDFAKMKAHRDTLNLSTVGWKEMMAMIRACLNKANGCRIVQQPTSVQQQHSSTHDVTEEEETPASSFNDDRANDRSSAAQAASSSNSASGDSLTLAFRYGIGESWELEGRFSLNKVHDQPSDMDSNDAVAASSSSSSSSPGTLSSAQQLISHLLYSLLTHSSTSGAALSASGSDGGLHAAGSSGASSASSTASSSSGQRANHTNEVSLEAQNKHLRANYDKLYAKYEAMRGELAKASTANQFPSSSFGASQSSFDGPPSAPGSGSGSHGGSGNPGSRSPKAGDKRRVNMSLLNPHNKKVKTGAVKIL